MVNRFKNRWAKPHLSARLHAVLLACLSCVGISFCQTTGTTGGGSYDYTADISSANSSFASILSTNGPALFGVLFLAVGFGFVWRMVKKGAHSV